MAEAEAEVMGDTGAVGNANSETAPPLHWEQTLDKSKVPARCV